MAIRNPSMSVGEAKQLAKSRSGELPASPRPSTLEGNVDHAENAKGVQSKKTHSSPIVAVHSTPMSAPIALLFPDEPSTEQKVQVFLSAPLPAPGVSKSFDSLCSQYPARKALQMILRRALDFYDLRLEDGSYKKAPINYPIGSPDPLAVIQTSRMIPVRLVEIARSHFDPLGFESARAFGRKLACAALASFFEAEQGRRR